MSARRESIASKAAFLGIGLMCAAADQVVQRAQKRIRGIRGRVVVITGASRGLGLALAEEFGQRGARVAISARDPYELDRARRQLLNKGSVRVEADILAFPADLRIQKDAEALIAQATGQFGRVDVLVNNAGVMMVGPVENQNTEKFRDAMESNFFTTLHCTQAVLPQMLERGEGAIANITSIGGKVAFPHLLPYTASKFAALGFSEGLSVELRSKGIRVTTVVPGLMRTGSHRNAYFTGDAAREYRWFSLAANMPGVSIGAARAARHIADAILRGTAEITITPHAFMVARLADVAPRLTHRVMRGVQVLLPDAQPSNERSYRGEDVREREWLPATTLGTSAARRYNQTGAMTS